MEIKNLKETDNCPYCNKNSLYTIEKGNQIMLSCSTRHCEKFNRWIKWLPTYGAKQRRKIKKILPDINYCEMCLRKAEEKNLVLEEHHIFEYESNPEIDDDLENRWKVCIYCHTLIHTIRRYTDTNNRKKEDYA